MMNFKKLSFLSILLLIFFSCSDDDSNKLDETSIIGKWNFQNVVSNDVKTNSAANDAKVKTYILADVDDHFSQGIFTFGKDKSVTFVNQYYIAPLVGTYIISNEKVTIVWSPDFLKMNIKDLILENGKLTMIKDYTSYLNGLELDELIELGLSTDLEVSKASVTMVFQRK